MLDRDILDEQKVLSKQIMEALLMLQDLPKQVLKNEGIKNSKNSAISKILRAKKLVEEVSAYDSDTLEQKKQKLNSAKQATIEAVNEIEMLVRFCSIMKKGIEDEVKKIADKINIARNRKIDESNDDWVHILHLSDLHFGYYNHSLRGTPEQDKKEYFDIVQIALFEFLKNYIQINDNIDIIAITGDISYQNDAGGYDDFESWLKALCHKDVLDIDITKNVIMCAGNHDSGYEKRSEFGIISNEEAEKHKEKKDKSVDYILSIDNISQRQEQFSLFNNVCLKLGIEGLTNFDMSAKKTPIRYLFGKREIKGINFIVLNTAWNSFPKRTKDGEENGYNHGELYLGRRLIRNFLPQKKDQKTTITLFHHPLSWLHETESRTYGEDQELPVFKCIREISDIILNGHVHGKIEPPDILANKTLVFSGGTLNTNDSMIFQFEILSVNTTRHYCVQKIVTYNRQTYGEHSKGWMIEAEDNLPQFYFDTYRYARELLTKISLNEITKEEILLSVKDDVKKAFSELYEKSNYYAIDNITDLDFKQTQENVNHLNEGEEKSKTKSKE